MKPRNKIERECVALSCKLPDISNKQFKYAIEHCFEHKAAMKSSKHNTWYCLDCGNVFTDTSTANTVTCPHCGHKLSIDGVRRQKKNRSSFQFISQIQGYYVHRTFHIFKETQWKAPAQYTICEVIQRFIKPNQKTVVLARNRSYSWYYCDSFSFSSELSVKKDYGIYLVESINQYGMSKYKPLLIRNGFNNLLLNNMSFIEVFDRLISNPHWETVAKKWRFDIWQEMNTNELNTFWPQVKMIMRHNYMPDIRTWKDMLHMAKKYHLDYFSPEVVMAKDLQKVHNKYLAVHLAVERKEREKREAEEARRRAEEQAKREEEEKKYEMAYAKLNKPWLGIVIKDGNIIIKPLQNRKEFVEEGDKMHHCVSMYFKRENSLILSARENGKRIATIELDKKDFSVVQCRSYCNQVPEKYDKLMSIMQKNRKRFVQAS